MLATAAVSYQRKTVARRRSALLASATDYIRDEFQEHAPAAHLLRAAAERDDGRALRGRLRVHLQRAAGDVPPAAASSGWFLPAAEVRGRARRPCPAASMSRMLYR